MRAGVDRGAFRVPRRRRLLVRAVNVVLDEERAVASHVLKRREPLALGGRRQAGHAVLEHPAIQLLDAQLLAGPERRLEVLPDAEAAVGIDPPRQLDPEL